jgi:hypothetical protein
MFFRSRWRSKVFKIKEIFVEVVLGFFNRTGFSKLHRLIFSYSSFFVAPAFIELHKLFSSCTAVCAPGAFAVPAEDNAAQATITRERTQ